MINAFKTASIYIAQYITKHSFFGRTMNLNIKHKLLLTVLIPIIGLFILASIEVKQKIGQYNETIAAINAVELSIKASELVHQLQKERGMTAGFLGSKGQKFST